MSYHLNLNDFKVQSITTQLYCQMKQWKSSKELFQTQIHISLVNSVNTIVCTLKQLTCTQSSLKLQLLQKLLYSFLHAGQLVVSCDLQSCLPIPAAWHPTSQPVLYLSATSSGQGLLLVAIAALSVVCSVPSVFHHVVEFVQHPELSAQYPELAVLPQDFDSLCF